LWEAADDQQTSFALTPSPRVSRSAPGSEAKSQLLWNTLSIDAALSQSGKSSSQAEFQVIDRKDWNHRVAPRLQIGSFCDKVSRFVTRPRGYPAI
jgi:hypothetical protein